MYILSEKLDLFKFIRNFRELATKPEFKERETLFRPFIYQLYLVLAKFCKKKRFNFFRKNIETERLQMDDENFWKYFDFVGQCCNYIRTKGLIELLSHF